MVGIDHTQKNLEFLIFEIKLRSISKKYFEHNTEHSSIWGFQQLFKVLINLLKGYTALRTEEMAMHIAHLVF